MSIPFGTVAPGGKHDWRRDFIDWNKKQIEELRRAVELMEAGVLTLRHQELGKAPVDMTASEIERDKRTIAELEALIKRAEAEA
ncbi:MAG: hypothetical protein J0I99_00860 [Devosia sp.]|uniref:hypothetical protein n=1 Tax=Devosia sp. TaxID=1871048 RepID=UPI001AC0FBCB|nr:hypothetical protein [Devosia sp.]MBN9308048.1 hypothetical protein [Devosia sp.]MBN9314268.1 hypothetical protein [Devosia sp.]